MDDESFFKNPFFLRDFVELLTRRLLTCVEKGKQPHFVGRTAARSASIRRNVNGVFFSVSE